MRASGLAFKNGMVYGLVDIDQNTTRFCTGDLFGLEDENGRTILQPKYSDIEYCGHGIFLATDVQKSNKYYFGDKRHFFNRAGTELTYALPDSAFLFNIFSFGEEADKDPHLVLDKFPSDTLLLFGYHDAACRSPVESDQQGLCNIVGKVFLPAIPGLVLFLEPGSAFVIRDGYARSIVNLKTWSTKPTTLQRNPGSIPKSRIPWTGNFQVSMPFPEDRHRKVVHTDNGQFDHDYWCDRRNYPIRSINMFNRFLHEYNLIGMPRDRVLLLLGEPHNAPPWATSPNALTYEFPNQSCTPYFSGIKIYIGNEHVTSWSFIHSDQATINPGKESKRFNTNVVLNDSLDGSNNRLVKSRIGEAGNTDSFPAIQPKPSVPK